MGDTDGVLERTGRWQIALLLLIGCNYTIVAINHALPTFHGYTPHYQCQFGEDSNSTHDRCLPSGEECLGGYQFHSPRNENSIVSEWSLICERRQLRSLVATIYFCGVTLGALLGGMAADRYGRRPVMLTCLFCQGALGLSLYLVTALEAFIAIRFVQGFFVQGLQGSTYTLLMELFPSSARTAVGVVLEVFWALGLVILVGCAYFLPDWRFLQLALTVPTLITLTYFCYVPESARWLKTRGRYYEADKVLRKIAKRNGHQRTSYNVTESLQLNACQSEQYSKKCEVLVNETNNISTSNDESKNPIEKNGLENKSLSLSLRNSDSIPMMDGVEEEPAHNGDRTRVSVIDVVTDTKEVRRGGIVDLFRGRMLRKFTFVMVLVWFSVSLSYYGIMFNLPDLSGDRHLNFFIGALLEAVSYGLSYFVLSRYGRRLPLASYLILSGLLCAFVAAISAMEAGSSGAWPTAQTVLALLGKAANVSAFCAIFIYTVELFPTVVRAAAMGHCGFWGRVGSLLAPQLLLLGEVTSAVVPMVSMSGLVILAGLATLLLPETFNRPLADTIQQAEEIHKQSRKRGKSGTEPVAT